MLGRKEYTRKEVDDGKERIRRGLAAYRKLAKDIGSSGDAKLAADLAGFEKAFFNNLALTLDRLYVHRLRSVTGKDTNPLNELELIVEALITNDGAMRATKVVKYLPADAVLGLEEGDEIELSAKDFERLSAEFFDDLERRFL